MLINGKSEWKYGFESKGIGNNDISMGSMIWDLIRLQNLEKAHPDIRIYFILAGFDRKINQLTENFDLYYDKSSSKKSDLVKNQCHFPQV